VSGASTFYSSTAGRPRYISQTGNDSALERSTVNVSQFTSTGVASPGQAIGVALNYLAGEGSQSSEYELEIDGIATTANTGQTARPITFALAIDGAIPGGAGPLTWGGVMLLVGNVGFAYSIRMRLHIVTSGAGGTCNIVMDGSMSERGVNSGGQSSPVTNSPNNEVGFGKAFDTTSSHTLEPRAWWNGTSTGQTITTYRTRVTRRM
jgi:hypothetical protein